MSVPLVRRDYIVQDEGICGGQPRIANTRLKIQHIALEYDYLGWTSDQICDAHLEIGLAEMHAAISYYYDHKQEIDATIQADREFAEQMARERV